MTMRRIPLAVLLLLPVPAMADALSGGDLAGDRSLPRTWGIGVNYFEMTQPYQLDFLEFSPSILPIPDPGILPIENDVRHYDLKFDAWVLPFVNVFLIYGKIDGETQIDLGVLGLPLPDDVNSLTVDYDGDVFGGGITLAVGGERWFASLTGTVTDSDLGSDFQSRVDAQTWQPRIGARFGEHTEFWIGGYLIEAEETHRGTITLDLGPAFPLPDPLTSPLDLAFAVDLSQAEDFNLSFGMHTMFAEAWEATIEVGGGERTTVLAHVAYRFE